MAGSPPKVPEVTGVRAWLRSKAKMITIYAGAAAAIISVAVGWGKLDLPRPALHSEVQAVQQYAGNTREIVLNQEWFRLSTQLKQAQAKLAHDPSNRDLIEEVVRLEQAKRATEEDLKQLAE